MSGRTLDAIEADEFALAGLLSDLGGDVSDEEAEAAVDEWMQELTDDRDRKLDGYGEFVRFLEARAAEKKARADQLSAGAKALEGRARWMKDRLLRYLTNRGIKKLECPLNTFSVQANGGSRAVIFAVAPEEFPEEYRETRTSFVPRTAEIRQALEGGANLPFASLAERGVSLRIR